MNHLVPYRLITMMIVPLLALSALLFAMPRSASAAGSIQLSHATVERGDHISVSGSGFTPNDSVVVSARFRQFNGQTKYVQVTPHANTAGTFVTPFVVQKSTPPGTYTVTARDLHGNTATAQLTVLPEVGLNVKAKSTPSTTIVAGGLFFALGYGYGHGEQVQISGTFSLNNGNVVTVSRTVQTDRFGNFRHVSLQVPVDARAGTAALMAMGVSSGRKATANVNVVPGHANASIVVSPPRPAPGSTITIIGDGFASGDRVDISASVKLTQGSTRVLSAVSAADTDGHFKRTLQLPTDTALGTYTVSAHGDHTVGTPTATITVQTGARINIQPVEGKPGQSVQVSGSGFSTSVPISLSATFQLYEGGSKTISQTVHSGPKGRIFARIVVPGHARAGTVTLAAQGPHSHVTTTLVVKHLGAQITLSPSSAGPNTAVSVIGRNFPAGDTVDLTAGIRRSDGSSVTLTATGTAGSDGGFTARLQVPGDAATGSYTVVALSRMSGRAPTATLTVTSAARIDLQPNPVAPGGTVQVTGVGYSPGVSVAVDVNVPLYGGGNTTVSTTASTGSRGRFVAQITIPGHAAAGTVQVTGTGPHTAASTQLVISHVPAKIVVSPSTIHPGASFTVLGTGFLAGDKVDLVTSIRLSGGASASLSTTQVTDRQGQFSAMLHLPAETGLGTYTVTATSERTGRAPAAQFAVALAAGIQLQPSAALPNHSISISGSGFSAGTSVTVSATFPLYEGGSKTVSQVVNAGPNGGIYVQLMIPGHASAGTVKVSAQGPQSKVTAALFIQHIAAGVTVSPSSILPGSTASVHGTGFPPGDTVEVGVATTTTTGASRRLTVTVQANNHGEFTSPLQIPSDTAVNRYTLIAKSSSTGRAPHAAFTVAVAASISLVPASVLPGESVSIRGGGYSVGVDVVLSASIPLYGGGNRTIGTTVRTDAQGGFSTHLDLPRKAASGTVNISARGPHTQRTAQVFVRRVAATLSLSPNQATPGSAVTVSGSGYLPNDTVRVAVTVVSVNGAGKPLVVSATTDAQGHFSAVLHIPADARGGTYTVVGESQGSGRSPSTQLRLLTLKASLVALPTSAAPGTAVSVTGVGFTAGAAITVDLQGRHLASATTDGSGRFSVAVTIPSDTASGMYSLSATSAAGRKASLNLTVQRAISTHFYFASLYTGTNHEERIALLNPTQTRAHVVITYQLNDGSIRTKSLDVAAHSRATEDVNADLGFKVSASAVVSSGVGIVAERRVIHVTDGSIVPGVRAPSRIWYFANGNTSHGYREYIAIQNPSNSQIQVAIKLLPTHSKSVTVFRTMAPHSRTTVKVNTYVRDAVGVVVTAGVPIVANRTIDIAHGMTSKIGAIQPQGTWYFATGPRAASAKYWIGAINPSNQRTYVTLRAYGPFGQQLGTAQGWLNPDGRVGYLINRIAHATDVSVVLTASHPIVAEQMTYAGRHHDAGTDTFGISTPARSYGFAAVDTLSVRAFEDVLGLFNPSGTSLPITVKYFRANGAVVEKTYVVGPLSHMSIDVGSIVPNAQLGMLAASDRPFVAQNRAFFNGRKGSMTSTGVPL